MTYVQRVPAFHLPRVSPVLPLIVALHIAFIYALNSDVTIIRPRVPADLIAVILPGVHPKAPDPQEPPKPDPVRGNPTVIRSTPIPGPVPLWPAEEPVERPIVQQDDGADLAAAKSVKRLSPRIDARHPIGGPEYPSAAIRMNETGLVKLSVCVAIDGRIADVTVQTSSGYSRLDQAAVAHLRKLGMRMLPGTDNDRAVPMCTDLAIRFELRH